MKRFFMMNIAMLVLLVLVASPAVAVDRAKYSRNNNLLKTEMDRASYSIGMSLGRDFKTRDIAINPEIIAMGIRDMLEGNELLMSEDQAIAALQELQNMAAAKQQEFLAQMAETNKANGEAFLAENGKRDGVKTTDTGLQYEILTAGTGKTPQATDQVKVDYRGTFIDGTEFDSSYQRGEPASFSVQGIIPGWTEALLMMKVGAKWKLFVPSALAYGEQGAPPVIEPNSTLVFEVELKEIL